MDRSQNQVRRVSTEVIEESLGLSRFDEVPTLQTGGLLNNGAVFDKRPGRRKELSNLSARVVNSAESSAAPGSR